MVSPRIRDRGRVRATETSSFGCSLDKIIARIPSIPPAGVAKSIGDPSRGTERRHSIDAGTCRPIFHSFLEFLPLLPFLSRSFSFFFFYFSSGWAAHRSLRPRIRSASYPELTSSINARRRFLCGRSRSSLDHSSFSFSFNSRGRKFAARTREELFSSGRLNRRPSGRAIVMPSLTIIS